MHRMHRKQIYIRELDQAYLTRESLSQGVSEAEVIRRCIETAASTPTTGIQLESAWLRAQAVMASRREAAGQPRSWTRDDLYDRDQRTGASDSRDDRPTPSS
jgi:hypothetical protein